MLKAPAHVQFRLYFDLGKGEEEMLHVAVHLEWKWRYNVLLWIKVGCACTVWPEVQIPLSTPVCNPSFIFEKFRETFPLLNQVINSAHIVERIFQICLIAARDNQKRGIYCAWNSLSSICSRKKMMYKYMCKTTMRVTEPLAETFFLIFFYLMIC